MLQLVVAMKLFWSTMAAGIMTWHVSTTKLPQLRQSTYQRAPLKSVYMSPGCQAKLERKTSVQHMMSDLVCSTCSLCKYQDSNVEMADIIWTWGKMVSHLVSHLVP